MEARMVAHAIHHEITSRNIEILLRRYTLTDQSTITGRFKRSIEFCYSLSDIDQEILFEIIRQSAVDTASTVLGIIEGSVIPKGIKNEFSLSYGNEEIGYSLQSEFLNVEEKHWLSRDAG